MAIDRAIAAWLTRPGVALLARLALASPFLVSGVLKATDFAGAVAEVRGLLGLEPAGLLAAAVIATQFGGSALFVAGGRLAWIGAVLLGGFTALATLLAHAFWTKTGMEAAHDLTTFFEHVGLTGGFLAVAILCAQRLRPA
jgi:uncharacterized membrane protein YphA (DoxX/SURF4 family)